MAAGFPFILATRSSASSAVGLPRPRLPPASCCTGSGSVRASSTRGGIEKASRTGTTATSPDRSGSRSGRGWRLSRPTSPILRTVIGGSPTYCLISVRFASAPAPSIVSSLRPVHCGAGAASLRAKARASFSPCCRTSIGISISATSTSAARSTTCVACSMGTAAVSWSGIFATA